ncbi:hypothetical protein [Streptomyces goshikiensis]|uniref:hypothetical protein n=1 Tax=Streptomyces goshikiensis TaxID=1942 RepID=UPI0037B1557F
MTTTPNALALEFARQSLDESLALLPDAIGRLVDIMVRASSAEDPAAAMRDLAAACDPFAAVIDRSSWVQHVRTAKPDDPEYASHIITTVAPPLPKRRHAG